MSKPEEKKRTFEVNNVKYAVQPPTMEDFAKANRLRSETFNELFMEGKTLLRDQLEEELRKRQLWSDDREARYQKLRREVIDFEFVLAKGGIKLSDARAVAIKMRDKRQEMVELLSSRTNLDSNTCEGKADAVRFNSLLVSTLVYEDSGERVYAGLDEYINGQDEEVAETAGSELFYLLSNTEQSDDRLPENKFLKKFKFTNDKYQLVNKEGKLVDEDGKCINELGQYIRWTSEKDWVLVDELGRDLNKDGDFAVEHSAFLDEEGDSIDEASFNPVEEEEKPAPKKRTRKKKVATADAE